MLQIAFVMLTLTTSALAQESFQYVYDETRQLIKAIDSSGTIIEYIYDAVGNLLETRRSTIARPVAIFTFTPQEGGPGTTVTIQGQGFSARFYLKIRFNSTATPQNYLLSNEHSNGYRTFSGNDRPDLSGSGFGHRNVH